MSDSAKQKIRCGNCQSIFEVLANQSGSRVTCSNCGAVIVVPQFPTSPPQPVAHQPAPEHPTAGASAGGASLTPPVDTHPSPTPTQETTSSGMFDLPSNSPGPTAGATGESSLLDLVREGADTPGHQLYRKMTTEIGKVFVGQDELVLGTLVGLFSSGHVLIESVPGLGKTLFVRTLGQVLGCDFGRIQFTPDLMPSDITGSPIFDQKSQEFRFHPGPVFTQLLLADEINRAPAKTHAALLETMQEYRVTVDSKVHHLARPFFVLATQNPIESEGTYNLPEAQLDRFMFLLKMDYPTLDEENAILRLHGGQNSVDDQLEQLEKVTSPEEIQQLTQSTESIVVDDRIIDYITKLVRQTRQWPQIYMGASPRAGITLMRAARTLALFAGRDFVVPDDISQLFAAALRHRIILTPEAEVEGFTSDQILKDVIRSVEVPRID